MIKRERAIELRNVAVAVVKAHGIWTAGAVHNGPKALWFHDQARGIHMTYRTPFISLPEPSDKIIHKAAIHGEPLKPTLPYGLDIWAPEKVLSVAWSDEGDFEMIGYKPGDWEKRLLELYESDG